MGLIQETAGVFGFLRDFFGTLPNAVQILIYGAFGGVLYIAFMRSLWR